MQVLKKRLTKTDIEKRLSIPTEKKKCFLDFTGSDKVKFTAVDKNGEVWYFVCSKRKKETSYPKPVLSKGWLQFVHEWKLAIGDVVTLELPKTVKCPYRISVIRNVNQASEVLPSPVKKRNRTMRAASYGSVTDNESAVITNSSGLRITYYRNERCCDKPKSCADSIDTELRLTSISLEPPMQLRKPIRRHYYKPQSSADSVDSEFKFTYPSPRPHVQQRKPICFDFFALELQHRGEKEQPTFQSISHMVESPITVSETPYFKFL